MQVIRRNVRRSVPSIPGARPNALSSRSFNVLPRTFFFPVMLAKCLPGKVTDTSVVQQSAKVIYDRAPRIR